MSEFDTNNGTPCFLCEPDIRLTYFENRAGRAIAGLGPLGPGYSVVASRPHVKSCADAATLDPDYVQFVETVRSTLQARFGTCLMTEHGRVPACVDVSGAAHPHCFHAHFLMFPGVPDISEKALRHFAKRESAATLKDALDLAPAEKEYFLVSPGPDQFDILTRPGRFIRQFARWLVADALRSPELTNWATTPNWDRALQVSAELSPLFSQVERTTG